MSFKIHEYPYSPHPDEKNPIPADKKKPSDYKVALVAGGIFTLLAVLTIMGYHHVSGFDWVATMFQNDTGLLAVSVALGTAGTASFIAGIYLLTSANDFEAAESEYE